MATIDEEGELIQNSGGCSEEQAKKLVQEKKHQLQGGYECIFVKAPPEILQTECPVCLCVLKEPYLIDCCGNSFCRSCIEPIKSDNKPCPLCNVQFTASIPDKRLQRTLNELRVHCCHKEAGCEWIGELGGLPQHLNLKPQDEGDRLSGCQLVSMECAFCGDDILRKDLKEHEEEKCLERSYICEYCENFESTFDNVTINHCPVCPSRPVSCPNDCGTSPKLGMLDDHIENECALQIIDCAFKYTGCNERLLRQDMPNHITQNLALHMSLQATSHEQELKKVNSRINELVELQNKSAAEMAELRITNRLLQEESAAKIAELRITNQLLQERLDQQCKNRVTVIGQEIKWAQEQRLKGHLGTLRGEIKKAQDETKQEITKYVDLKMAVVHIHVGLIPFSFTMPDFEQKKRSSSSWYGPPFYTHPHGYKMCLNVDANGWGDGTNSHVSMFLHMMQGEYDESLKWPFRGDVTVQLLNQIGDSGHHSCVIHITDHVPHDVFMRVVSRERSLQAWGSNKFISHGGLLPNYLKDDCLKLCIKKVDLKS